MALIKKQNRKGQSLQILLFALVIIGIGVGLMAFTTLTAAPQIFGDTMSDVPVISESQSRTDDAAHHYIPLSAHYAVADAVYEVGTGNSPILTLGQLEAHYDLQVNAVETLSDNMFDNYISQLEGRWFQRCQVHIPDKELAFGIESDYVNVTQDSGEDAFVRTECATGDFTVQTQNNMDRVDKQLSNIRFHELMVMLINGLEAVHEESEDAEEDNDYYGTVTAESGCFLDGPDKDKEERAKEDASEKVQEAAEDEIQSLLDRFENAGDTEVDNLEIGEDEEAGIFDRFIDFVTFWSSEDGFSWEFNAVDESTEIEEQSNTVSNCECLEWGCEGYIDDPTYDSNDGNQCTHEDEPFDDPHCDSYDDLEHDGSGECEPENRPSVCSSGTYNESSGVCEDDDGDFEEWPCDDDWDYTVEEDGGDYECIHDDEGSDAECESDAATVSGGSCVHDGSRPDPVCTLQPVKAEAESYYELEEYWMDAFTKDEKYEIPTEDGWVNLIIDRKYQYDFPEP